MDNRNQLLADWRKANEQLAELKTLEMALRKEVIDAFSEKASDEMAAGMENVDIGWGHVLKIEHKLDYKFDNANDYEKLDAVLDTIESEIEGGNFITDRIAKRKYEISVSEYKKLPPRAKELIDTVLTIKPATPSVKIEKAK